MNKQTKQTRRQALATLGGISAVALIAPGCATDSQTVTPEHVKLGVQLVVTFAALRLGNRDELLKTKKALDELVQSEQWTSAALANALNASGADFTKTPFGSLIVVGVVLVADIAAGKVDLSTQPYVKAAVLGAQLGLSNVLSELEKPTSASTRRGFAATDEELAALTRQLTWQTQ